MKSKSVRYAGRLQGASANAMKIESLIKKINTNIILGVTSYNWPANNGNRFVFVLPPKLCMIILQT